MLDPQFIVDLPTLTLAWQDALSNSISGAAPAAGAPIGPAGGAGTGGTPAPGGGMTQIFIMMGFLLLVMVLMSTMTGRREKKRRAELLASIKKGDRVLTIGGIIGRVTDISGDEVVLKIDENSNVRTRFTLSAVQQVLKTAETGGSAESGGASGGGNGTSNSPSAQVEVKSGRSKAAT